MMCAGHETHGRKDGTLRDGGRSSFHSLILLCLTVLALVVLAGCGTPPYEFRDNWAFRQNSVPQYFARYDVFYIYPKRFDEADWFDREVAIFLYDDVKHRIQGVFGKKVRVFSPLVHESKAAEECAEALEYYLDHYHDPQRPFIVLVEGRDDDFVEEFRDEASGVLKAKKGLVAFARTNDFSAETTWVESFSAAVRRRRILISWNEDWQVLEF